MADQDRPATAGTCQTWRDWLPPGHPEPPLSTRAPPPLPELVRGRTDRRLTRADQHRARDLG